MKRGQKIAAMVKARGGSKGLPGKNIRPLCGKPLIGWAVETALKCPSIDYTFVSTDSKEIADIAAKHGAEVPFLRPAEFAHDTAHDGEVLLHAVEALEKQGKSFDVILTLHPTSPLRRPDDLEKAIDLITEHNCGSALSVTPSFKAPFWMFTMEGPKLKKFVDDGVDYFNLERQQLPKTYQLNGIVYATRVSEIKKLKVMITPDAMGFVVEQSRSIAIDSLNDFRLAELAMQDILAAAGR